MSWHFSRALVEEFSVGTCSDGEQFVPLNTTPTPEAFYWPDKTTEHSRLSRFGMTSVPLTVDHGEDILTSFRAAFPAKTSAQPEKALDLTESEAAYGQKWHGLFAKWDRDTCMWKTPQCSLLGDLEQFSETWPRWGSMRNGASFLRQIPALPIYGNESGFVPNSETFWHTPTTGGLDGGSNSRRALANRAMAPVMWQTPVADDAMNRAAGKWNSRGEPKLSAEVKMWPTATMAKGSSPASLTRKSGEDRSNDRLDHAVMASDGGQLNPTWVEWLMGWPIGWTDLKPLEMAKFQEWQQQHGGF